jgi:uncharacterized protein (DUF433 family)
MNQFDRITSDPAIMNGQPCIRGMRLTVRRILEALTVYPNWSDLRAEYPELELDDIRQALGFAARVGTMEHAARLAWRAETR